MEDGAHHLDSVEPRSHPHCSLGSFSSPFSSCLVRALGLGPSPFSDTLSETVNLQRKQSSYHSGSWKVQSWGLAAGEGLLAVSRHGKSQVLARQNKSVSPVCSFISSSSSISSSPSLSSPKSTSLTTGSPTLGTLFIRITLQNNTTTRESNKGWVKWVGNESFRSSGGWGPLGVEQKQWTPVKS